MKENAKELLEKRYEELMGRNVLLREQHLLTAMKEKEIYAAYKAQLTELAFLEGLLEK